MGTELDNEIDGLLRQSTHRVPRTSLARAASAVSATAASDDARGVERTGGAHLDADEISAFAEGALPAATRLPRTR